MNTIKKIFLSGFLISNMQLMAQNIQTKKQEISVPIVNGQLDLLTNVTYEQIIGQRSVREMKMTLLIPRDQKLKPVIVYFPGGGFISAEYDKYFEMKTALAKAGFVVVGVDYRVVPDRFPALLIDAKAAIRYLKAHAKEFGIDPDRIGVLGDSAGGYLSQITGATNGDTTYDQGDYLDQNSNVQAVASLYGISNLLNIGEGFPENIENVHQSPAVTEALLVNGPAFGSFPGAAITSDSSKALIASPIGYIKKNMPPYLLMHGTADQLVSPKQSEQMYNALVKEGNKVEYYQVKGAQHGDITWYQPVIIDKVVNFFKQTLGAPKDNPNATKKNSNL